MAYVQYRALFYRRGGALGDRTVVGVAHWDGDTLRTAFGETRIGLSDRIDGAALRDAVQALRARAARFARANVPQQSLLPHVLDDVFPVVSGVGSSLLWSETRFAEPTRPEEHFAHLCRSHGLVIEPPADSPETQVQLTPMNPSKLRKGLRKLGERLQERFGAERIRVDEATGAAIPFVPPLSWKNGVWHHAVPVSFDVGKAGALDDRAFSAAGQLAGGIAADEVPVLVVAMPASMELREAAALRQGALRNVRSDAQLVEAARDPETRFDELEELIERDVRAAH